MRAGGSPGGQFEDPRVRIVGVHTLCVILQYQITRSLASCQDETLFCSSHDACHRASAVLCNVTEMSFCHTFRNAANTATCFNLWCVSSEIDHLPCRSCSDAGLWATGQSTSPMPPQRLPKGFQAKGLQRGKSGISLRPKLTPRRQRHELNQSPVTSTLQHSLQHVDRTAKP